MIAIVCVDNKFGMLFNNRRLSQDGVVINKIVKMSSQNKLWMNSYSYKLFDNVNAANINIDDNFLSEASHGEFCFVEDKKIKRYEKWIEKIVLLKWNRDYPSDLKFDIDISTWELEEAINFVGNSHKNITMEVYKK